MKGVLIQQVAVEPQSARSFHLGQENCEIRADYIGRNSRPHHGGSRVLTTDDSPEVSETALSGGFAEAKPSTRQIPLQLWKERNEAMGLPSSQVARKGAKGNDCGAASKRHQRLVVHTPLRRSLERKHRKWLLRWSTNGPSIPILVWSRLCKAVGYSRQLACVGTAYRRTSCQRQRPRVLSLAEYSPEMRADLTHMEGAKCLTT